MLVIRLRSPSSHSQIPGILPKPNTFDKDGRRTSPSSSKVLRWVHQASAQARLAETMLLPSCGIVLVISSFLSARLLRRCRRRTLKKTECLGSRSVVVREAYQPVLREEPGPAGTENSERQPASDAACRASAVAARPLPEIPTSRSALDRSHRTALDSPVSHILVQLLRARQAPAAP